MMHDRRSTVKINQSDLVMVAVMGQIAHPVGAANPYRIGHDGVPRVLPATGGIVLNQRIGDRCVGLAGDHIEPGVSLHNNSREVIGSRQGPNLALVDRDSEEDAIQEVSRFEIQGQSCAIVEAEPAPVQPNLADLLSGRELQIASLVSLGRVNKQIARQLHISEWTVATYIRRIFYKLGVDSRAAMVYRCASLIQQLEALKL